MQHAGGKARGAQDGSTAAGTPGSLLLIDVDPHLVCMVRELYPRARVVLLQPEDDLDALLHDSLDLVVVDLASPRLPQVQLFGEELRLLGVGRSSDHGLIGRGVDAVVVRPHDRAVLRETIARLIDPPRRPAARLRFWQRHPAGLLPFLELSALALAIPEIAGGGSLNAVAVTLAAVVAVAPRSRPAGYLSATALAAFLLVTAANPTTSFVPYALVVAARAGVEAGARIAPLCGVVLALAALPAAMATAATDSGHTVWLSTAVFPLTAFAVGQAVRLRTVTGLRSHDAREVHRTLMHLQGLVQWLPDDLSLPQAAHRVARDAARAVGVGSAIVLTGRAVLRPLACHGCVLPVDFQLAPDDPAREPLRSRWTTTRALTDRLGLPPGFAWRAVPLVHRGETLGLLLLGKRPDDEPPSPRVVHRAVRAAALDLANATLLRRLQQLGTDAERARLVRELKDGLAQSLSHVRFELASLERDIGSSDAALAGRVHHLRQVSRSTMLDLAAAVADLRATSSGSGLTAAIHEFAREMMGGTGPIIEVRGEAGPRLDPLVEQELFEITAHTVAAAIRRAGVSYITILLERTEVELTISVEDDGRWVSPGPAVPGARRRPDVRRERAERVGARLALTMPDERHHRVSVTFPCTPRDSRQAGL